MRHGSLFSGIGGFDLAAEWMGWENIFQVEKDPYCQKVLTKNFPNVKRYGDIKEFKGEAGSVDVLTGGFPCQPFSHAGKRKGESDDRYLWPEYLRVIREIQPTYVVGENVAGLISMEDGKTLEGIFTDLEGEGYEVESFIIPACGVGAWHRRDRIWILAYPCHGTDRADRRQERKKKEVSGEHREAGCTRELSGANSDEAVGEDVSNTDISGCEECGEEQLGAGQPSQVCGREAEPRLDRMVDGISYWMDEPKGVSRVTTITENRNNRLKALGNAIVPQVAYELFKAIQQLDDQAKE